jgi:GDP-4-dehydro-6-deoxy-D-mannose reductase
MNKKILVTGVRGFLGGAFWRYLKKKKTGWNVYGLDLGNDKNDPHMYKVDLRHRHKLEQILGAIQPDYIFHFAGGRVASKKKLMELNYSSTKHLLETVKKLNGLRTRVIIPGSAAEYGKMPPGRRLFRENDKSRPLTEYGLVKLKQTQLALAYASDGLDVVVARIFNIMGEGTPPSLAAGRFAEQIVGMERGGKDKILYTKNLMDKRDFLDIQDVCRGLMCIAQHGVSGQIYNICSSRPVKIKDLLKDLLAYAKVGNIFINEDKQDLSMSFDVIGSNRKLRSVSRWQPRVQIRQSLKKTLYSYRSVN